jgi:ABC-type antimicrobial peptide transport system permease subunit
MTWFETVRLHRWRSGLAVLGVLLGTAALVLVYSFGQGVEQPDAARILAGSAAIALLMGGIAVMHVMLLSVGERVREVGVRKALGATPRTIRRQFVAEAAGLGLVGGVAGAALRLLGAWLLPSTLGPPVTASTFATVVRLAVAVVIGVALAVVVGSVAGVYPAERAARLVPIDALLRCQGGAARKCSAGGAARECSAGGAARECDERR